MNESYFPAVHPAVVCGVRKLQEYCFSDSEEGNRELFSCRLLGINYQQDARLHSLPDTGDEFIEIEGFL